MIEDRLRKTIDDLMTTGNKPDLFDMKSCKLKMRKDGDKLTFDFMVPSVDDNGFMLFVSYATFDVEAKAGVTGITRSVIMRHATLQKEMSEIVKQAIAKLYAKANICSTKAKSLLLLQKNTF